MVVINIMDGHMLNNTESRGTQWFFNTGYLESPLLGCYLCSKILQRQRLPSVRADITGVLSFNSLNIDILLDIKDIVEKDRVVDASVCKKFRLDVSLLSALLVPH